MADAVVQLDRRPVAITPAPPWACTIDICGNEESPQPTMPYSCQNCAKRKVKCDKSTPICASCRKGKLRCIYQTPPPRRRKRDLSRDINERLAQYERILRQHGLLPQDANTPYIEETPQEPISLRFIEPETSRTGKVLSSQGKSRYIDSSLWRSLGDDAIQSMPDDEEEDQAYGEISEGISPDPLTGEFVGSQQCLLQYHPTNAEAMVLWETHIENVEPICKILHIPSTGEKVQVASRQPSNASKADECLLFAIYHFAVFSMTEEDCISKFGQSRDTLMHKYHFATRQALVNASFLKTTEMSILQALVLFLLSCRHFYDPHTNWILTGVAVRISQRMGLHRDGEKLGLPPFEVQMRRRLFYQVLPLDGVASQLSGTGIAIMPDSWDTQQPSNNNDNQIWPGMTKAPKEQEGATEMIFCLARSCIGKYTVIAGKPTQGAGSLQSGNYDEVKLSIRQAECEVEEKYIRYCDIVNPLHFLTMISARSAINAMRLRILLPKVRNQTITDTEWRDLFRLTQKIMDADTAAYTNPNLSKYLWHMRSFFVWGSWDSLIFVLNSLWRSTLLSPQEIDAAWGRVEQAYKNHDELIESNRALQVAVRCLTLKAWDAKLPSSSLPEPPFINALRVPRGMNHQSRAERQHNNANNLDEKLDIVPLGDISSANDYTPLFDNLSGGFDFDAGNDFNFDAADWTFWEQLIKDNQQQGSQQ
jgi:hypothetical protein